MNLHSDVSCFPFYEFSKLKNSIVTPLSSHTGPFHTEENRLTNSSQEVHYFVLMLSNNELYSEEPYAIAHNVMSKEEVKDVRHSDNCL